MKESTKYGIEQTATKYSFTQFNEPIFDKVKPNDEVEKPTYKDRMKAEYIGLKAKYERLHRIIVKAKAKTLDFELDCPIELLEDQAAAMGRYLFILEVRAEIEKVELR